MSGGEPFAYAPLRVVPSIERGEAINVGVVLFCRRAGFLALRWTLPTARLAALDPALDLDSLAAHLEALERTAAGELRAGPIALQPPSERFHWLVAPSSTIVVAGDVHTGISADPQATLDHLFATLVQ